MRLKKPFMPFVMLGVPLPPKVKVVFNKFFFWNMQFLLRRFSF